MRREWMTDEERASVEKAAKWRRIDAWASGILQAAALFIVLTLAFSAI